MDEPVAGTDKGASQASAVQPTETTSGNPSGNPSESSSGSSSGSFSESPSDAPKGVPPASSEGIASAVILGATSALGQAVARQLADRGQVLILVARDAAKLAAVEADMTARGTRASSVVADLDDTERHADLVDSWTTAADFYLFYGTLPDQKATEADWAVAAQALHTNFLSAASLLTHIGNLCESRRTGRIVVVTSVAGDRGRQSNYVYGTAKGALSIFCQGLRNRLAKVNVPVTTIKPGFIDTPMTAGVPKKPAVLWATPEKVATDIVEARDKGRDVVYSPWFWRFILLIVCAVPERIFKKLSM